MNKDFLKQIKKKLIKKDEIICDCCGLKKTCGIFNIFDEEATLCFDCIVQMELMDEKEEMK